MCGIVGYTGYENAEGIIVDGLKRLEYRGYDSAGINLTGKKIVLDCANGAAYRVAPAVYTALGAEITVIGEEPDGININDNTGSTHPERLCETVKATGADIGLAFDGDADRLIAADENGNVVDGDRTICICAKMMKEEGRLAGNRVTATVMSNIGFVREGDSWGRR